MTLKELIQSLVETEDKMERMSLVEQNSELLEEGEEREEGAGESGEWEEKYKALEKRYIDTFFGAGKTDEESEENDEKEVQESDEDRAESIKIDDLMKKEDK